jgi:hypothetical protein
VNRRKEKHREAKATADIHIARPEASAQLFCLKIPFGVMLSPNWLFIDRG